MINLKIGRRVVFLLFIVAMSSFFAIPAVAITNESQQACAVIFHNRLGSRQDILHSQTGPGGKITGTVVFTPVRPGRLGAGFVDGDSRISFDKVFGNRFPKSGSIEFLWCPGHDENSSTGSLRDERQAFVIASKAAHRNGWADLRMMLSYRGWIDYAYNKTGVGFGAYNPKDGTSVGVARFYDLNFKAGDILHIKIVWSGDDENQFLKLFVDGKEINPVYKSGVSVAAAVKQMQRVMSQGDYDLELLRRSRRPDGAAHNFDENGRIAEFKISAGLPLYPKTASKNGAPGLQLYYTFDNDTNGVVLDSSGNHRNGRVVGNVEYRDSIKGKAPVFSSKDTYIVCDYPELNINGWTGITVSAFIKINKYTTYGTVLARADARYSMRPQSLNLSVGGSHNGGEWDSSGGMLNLTDEKALTRVYSHCFGKGIKPLPETGRWYHLCSTFDGKNYRFYVDGKLDNAAKVLPKGAKAFDFPGTSLLIGKTGCYRINWLDDYFDGQIDEVRIYNRALKPKEIRNLHDNIISASKRRLMLYYTFDNDRESKVIDSSGNGNDGKVFGNVVWTADSGVRGKAIRFDGETSYIEVGDELDAGNGNLTISAWVKSENLRQYAKIINKGRTNCGIPFNSGYSLRIVTPGYTATGKYQLRFDFTDDNRNQAHVGIPVDRLPTNQFFMVTGVLDRKRSGTFLKLYINGKEVSNTFDQLGGSDSNIPLAIGAMDRGNYGDQTKTEIFNGFVDEVRIYKAALSAGDIAALYRETVKGIEQHTNLSGPELYYSFDAVRGAVVADESGNGHNAVVHNARWTRSGMHGGAMDFNGVNAYLSTTKALNKNDDLTIAMWIKPRKNDMPAEGHRLLYCQNPLPSHSCYCHGYGFIYNGSLVAYDGGYPPAYGQINAHSPVFTNRWQFVAVTRSGNKVVHYLNGRLNGAGTADTFEWDETGDLATIGGRVYNGLPHQFYDGMIDELRIYKRALSNTEIQQLYSRNATIAKPADAKTKLLPKRCLLNINSTPGGFVSRSSGEFVVGSRVAVSACASNDFVFVGWQLDQSRFIPKNTIQQTMNKPHRLQAVFKPNSFGFVIVSSPSGKLKSGVNSLNCRIHLPANSDPVLIRWQPMLPVGSRIIGADGNAKVVVDKGTVIVCGGFSRDDIELHCRIALPRGKQSHSRVSSRLQVYQKSGGLLRLPIYPGYIDIEESAFLR